MSCSLAAGDNLVSVQILTLVLPWSHPLSIQSLEASLQRAISDQIGPHQLLRWAITSVHPEQQQVKVEAVVTLGSAPETFI